MPQELLDVLDALDELDSELEVIAGQLEQLDSLAAAHHGPTQQVQQDKRIDSVWVDSNTGHIYVATEGGTQHRYPPYTDAQGEPQPVYVADSKGQRYVVDAAGQLHNLSQEPVPYNIRFAADASQKGGFDSLRIAALAGLFEPLVLGGEMQRISWKSIPAGESDGVWVSVREGSFPQEVKFRNSTGPVQVAAREGSRVKLLLPAPAAGLPDALIAYLEQQDSTGKAYEQQLGQLNLLGYNTLEQKLIVVPSGSQASPITAAVLEEHLRQIYAPAHVDWEVAVKEPQSLSGWDEGDTGLDDGGSGLLASYTAEMRKLVAAYLEQEAEEQDAVYLFLVDKSQSGQKKGFMPRSRRHGFIFLDAHGGQQTALIKTIAHELGHGAYNLEHLFKAYPAVAESSTDNLMDYQEQGTTMLKHQWNQVHDPVRVWGLFEEDEDGALIQNLAMDQYLNVSSSAWQNYTFLSPAGYAIHIPGVSSVAFTEDGGVINFKKDGKTYYGVFIRESQEFLGYLSEEHKSLLEGSPDRTVEWTNEFRTREYKDITFAEAGSQVYAKAKKVIDGSYVDCLCNATWTNAAKATTYYGIARPPFIPQSASVSYISGTHCVDFEQDGVQEGVGRNLYVGLVAKAIQLNKKSELVALANHLSTELGEANFYFYGHELENFAQYNSFITEVVTYFLENEIFSQEDLTTHFPYKIQKASDYGLIYSSVDLWPDEIPESYNASSVDYVKWRNDGKHVPYEYTLADLKVRQRHLESEEIIQVIRTLENLGLSEALATHHAYDQYVAKYGTDAAFIFIAQTASEWSHDLLAAIFLRQMAAEYGVFLMKEVVTQLGKETVRRLIREKGEDFVQGAIIDYTLQVTFSYAFDEKSFSEAADPENINWISVGASGLESTLSYNNKYAEYGIALSFACIVNGWSDTGGFKESFDFNGCAVGIVGAGLGKQVPLLFKYTRKFAMYSVDKLRAGLARLNITGQQADEVIEKIKNSADEGGGSSTNIAGKFSAKQIEDYVSIATKQNDKSKVMLGMWDVGWWRAFLLYYKGWKCLYLF